MPRRCSIFGDRCSLLHQGLGRSLQCRVREKARLLPARADRWEARWLYAPALVDAFNERFAFQTAESAAPRKIAESGGRQVSARLDALETGLGGIAARLDKLFGGDGVQSSAPLRPKPKQACKTQQYGNLDPSTVQAQAALSAGVPSEHLAELAKIMKDKPKRLDDLPRPPVVAGPIVPELPFGSRERIRIASSAYYEGVLCAAAPWYQTNGLGWCARVLAFGHLPGWSEP